MLLKQLDHPVASRLLRRRRACDLRERTSLSLPRGSVYRAVFDRVARTRQSPFPLPPPRLATRVAQTRFEPTWGRQGPTAAGRPSGRSPLALPTGFGPAVIRLLPSREPWRGRCPKI